MSIYLGSAPGEEECAQVGDDFFSSDARIELNAYQAQLKRTFVIHHQGIEVNYKKKRESHDFGSYSEIVIEPSGLQYSQSASVAYAIEHHVPGHWDLIAIREIIQSTACHAFELDQLTGSLGWMMAPVQTVEQGRRMLALIKKLRSGREVTTLEITEVQSLTLEVTGLEPTGVLKPFHMLVEEAGDDGETLEFECQAEDAEHACEQAVSAYPGCKVLMYFAKVSS